MLPPMKSHPASLPPRVERQWVIAPHHPDRIRLANEARIDPLLAQILLNRGVTTATDVRTFLAPEFRSMLPPESLPGAVEAARRLADAAKAGSRIVIYGDYDVDGVTATAILWHGLRLAGANVDYYIPRRLEEGYGLNADAIEQLASDGAQLIITVDCGITAAREAEAAKRLGVELIITDHHEPKSKLPDAALLVHPTALSTKCANPNLSGAGVAHKIAWALAQILSQSQRVTPALREYLLDATAFAALGLIADVVPLVGENRVIASFGLRQLHDTKNPGLQALIDVSGLSHKSGSENRSSKFDDYDVGFMLAPRLNAVGRMGHAGEAVELFTHADEMRAHEIATRLDGLNRERQSIEKEIVASAEAMVIERGMHRDSCRGIVLASREWHAGVIGIVASRIVERFGRPTVLISLDGEHGQGSGRSVRNFPLHEVLAACGTHLLGHGGHAMAAGVKVHADAVDAFTNAFMVEAANRLTPADLKPRLTIDDEVDIGRLAGETVEAIQKLAPFGIGNARPRLATGVVELIEEPRVIGKTGQHLRFAVRSGTGGNGAIRTVVAFNRGPERDLIADHPRMQIAFEPVINEWQGRKKVELKLVDWRGA